MKTYEPTTAPAASATMLCGLRRLRKAAGLSQAQAAGALRVSRQSYNSWENMRALPTATNVLALLDLFGCPIEDLYREKEEQA